MQLQADLLGRPVRVADAPEASALGVARLAARGLSGPRRPAGRDSGRDVRPALDEPARTARRAAWADAVARSRWRPSGAAPDPAARDQRMPEGEDTR